MKLPKLFVTAHIKREVERGAALLDVNKPGWRQRVNLRKLNVWDEKLCVLGQVYGSYDRGFVQLGLLPWRGDSEVYGFCPFEGEERALRRQWKRVIRRGR